MNNAKEKSTFDEIQQKIPLPVRQAEKAAAGNSGGGSGSEAHAQDIQDILLAQGDEGAVKGGGTGLFGHELQTLLADAHLMERGGQAQGGEELPGLGDGFLGALLSRR